MLCNESLYLLYNHLDGSALFNQKCHIWNLEKKNNVYFQQNYVIITRSLDITNVVFLELKIFLWVPATAVGTATVNPNGIKTLLANGLSTFFIKDKLVFNNGLRTLPRSSPDCEILDI